MTEPYNHKAQVLKNHINAQKHDQKMVGKGKGQLALTPVIQQSIESEVLSKSTNQKVLKQQQGTEKCQDGKKPQNRRTVEQQSQNKRITNYIGMKIPEKPALIIVSHLTILRELTTQMFQQQDKKEKFKHVQDFNLKLQHFVRSIIDNTSQIESQKASLKLNRLINQKCKKILKAKYSQFKEKMQRVRQQCTKQIKDLEEAYQERQHQKQKSLRQSQGLLLITEENQEKASLFFGSKLEKLAKLCDKMKSGSSIRNGQLVQTPNSESLRLAQSNIQDLETLSTKIHKLAYSVSSQSQKSLAQSKLFNRRSNSSDKSQFHGFNKDRFVDGKQKISSASYQIQHIQEQQSSKISTDRYNDIKADYTYYNSSEDTREPIE